MNNMPFPLENKNVTMVGYARTALYLGLKMLGISEGSEVIIPAYICNVVLAPFNYMGISVKYYDIDDSLTPNIHQIKNMINKKTKAIFAVNYFGFPQKINELLEISRNSGLFFIEDNAHGFLSGIGNHPLGSFGDIAIFSFRKTMNIPKGAALVINNTFQLKKVKISLRNDFLSDLLGTVKTAVKNTYPISIYRQVKNRFKKKTEIYHEESLEEENNLGKYLIRMPMLSYRKLSDSDYAKMRDERIKRYNRCMSMVTGNYKEVRPLFPELKEGVVPYVLPFRVNDRERLIERLFKDLNIRTFPWPTLPLEILARSKKLDLYRNIVCVPLTDEVKMVNIK